MDKPATRGGKRAGAGRPPSRGSAATCRLPVYLTTSEREELDRVASHHKKSASDLIRGLLADEGARIIFGGKAEHWKEIDLLKAFEARIVRLTLEANRGPGLEAGILNAVEILNDAREE
jgi:tyrosyl-tRNA synthetase